MRFPNAAKGIKRIFIAQILLILTSVVSSIGSSMHGTGGTPDDATMTVIVALFAVAGLISLIAFVLNLLGLNDARKDDGNFQTAFIITLVGIAVSVVQFIFSSNSMVADLMNTFSTICEALIVYYVVKGIISLAGQLGDDDMVARGKRLVTLVLVMWGVTIALQIVALFFNGSEALLAIGGILAIIGYILTIVVYVLYLLYLARAKKMLEA